jgi:hypothetical protein
MSTGFGARGVGNARWRTKTTRKGEHAPAQELARELGRSSARAALGIRLGVQLGAEFRRRPNLPYPRASANGRPSKSAPAGCYPWFAVAFGSGIVLYFAADHEPVWWAAAIAAVPLRRRAIAFVVALGLLATAAGFATATVKTALIAHPLLRYPGIMAQTYRA